MKKIPFVFTAAAGLAAIPPPVGDLYEARHSSFWTKTPKTKATKARRARNKAARKARQRQRR